MVTLDDGSVAYLKPIYASRDLDKLIEIDGNEMVTRQGDEVYLEFEKLDFKYKGRVSKIEIEANGYYELYQGYRHDPATKEIVPE